MNHAEKADAPLPPCRGILQGACKGGDMDKILNDMCSPNTGHLMLYIGIIMFFSKPITWIAAYLETFGIRLLPLSFGLTFILLGTAIVYLNDKYKKPKQTTVDKFKNINDFETRVAELEQQLADTRAQLAAVSQPQEVVTVDAALWEDSCRAACSVLVKIVGGGETDITNAAFQKRMAAAASGGRTHTKADKIAWKSLPDAHKAGPGRPQKTPSENPEHE